MRALVFGNRTFKEILRDPLSYIFCVGFPIVMLIVMSIVNDSIPAESGMTVFQLKNLTPGIMVFGLGFVMLFTCIQVSKDRTTALMLRLYTSPMKTIDFLIGYTLPVILIAFFQSAVTYLRRSYQPYCGRKPEAIRHAVMSCLPYSDEDIADWLRAAVRFNA